MDTQPPAEGSRDEPHGGSAVSLISEAPDGLDQSMADLAAQSGDNDFHRIRVHLGVAVIDALEKVATGDDMLLAKHETGQDAPFEGGQAQRQTVEAESAELRIIGDRPADDQRRGMACGPAHKRAQPHHNLFHAKRLDEIIVGAGLEAFDFFGPPVARGQDENRQGSAGCTPRPQHCDSADFRQAQIEHGRVIGFGIAEMLAVLPVRRNIDHEIFCLQRAGDRVGQKIIVLDKKDFHVAIVMKGRVS